MGTIDVIVTDSETRKCGPWQTVVGGQSDLLSERISNGTRGDVSLDLVTRDS